MKIGVNCGHTTSGAGTGAVGYISESKETRNVGRKLTELLDNGGHTVIDCTVECASSQNEYLKTAVSFANKYDLDLFVSIHFNAGGGKGSEVYTYKGEKNTEAVNVCSKLQELGFTNRGIKDGSNLYVIKHTKAQAMLIEVCFVDTQSDVDLYKKLGADKVAAAIYEAITGSKAADTSTGGSTSIGTSSNKKVFADISGHWAQKHIQKLADYGIVNGDNNGLFNPDKPITRAEAAVIAANVLTVLGK